MGIECRFDRVALGEVDRAHPASAGGEAPRRARQARQAPDPGL